MLSILNRCLWPYSAHTSPVAPPLPFCPTISGVGKSTLAPKLKTPPEPTDHLRTPDLLSGIRPVGKLPVGYLAEQAIPALLKRRSQGVRP
jgi:hypothetical protein